VNPLQAEFFTRLGLYAEREFLSPDLCAAVRAEMRSAEGAPATVAEGHEGRAVDEAYRKTKLAEVSAETAAQIGAALENVLPALAQHFDRELVGMQPPQFLLYREGNFFRPHRDDSEKSDAPGFVRQRSVSAVVFLNGAAPEEAGGYSGGSLTFYGLMDDSADGRSVGLPIRSETGLLVAFPSELLHAVSAITAGERYTVVTWFFEDATLSEPEGPETASAAPSAG